VQATALKATGFDPRSHTDAQVIWYLVLPEGNPALVPFQPNPAVLRDLNVGCGLWVVVCVCFHIPTMSAFEILRDGVLVCVYHMPAYPPRRRTA
jgi:hypothetical protein